MKYLIAYILPLSCLTGILFGGVWTFAAPTLAFVILPTVESVLSIKDGTPGASSYISDMVYTALLYLHLPLMYLIIFLMCQGIVLGRYSPIELAGVTLSVGIILGAIGMNLGHELGHRQGWLNQLWAHLFWLPNFYMHFGIEHNLWHHKYVATDDDPASAPEGMSLYRFWVVSVTGNIHTAWKLEQRRIERSEGGVNRVLLFFLIEIIYVVSIGLLFNGLASGLVVVAGFIGFLLLESVNYIEHYGLRRKKLVDGRWEAQTSFHSWNSNHQLGRIFLYELVRHPDHHMNALKHYQNLEELDKSPQLPYGYPGSILLALIPWLWKRKMALVLDNYR